MAEYVLAGEDADDPKAVEHGKASDVVGRHLIQRFTEWRVGSDASNAVRHAALDRERPSSLALRSFDVAARDDTNQLAVFDDRRASVAPLLERVRELG